MGAFDALIETLNSLAGSTKYSTEIIINQSDEMKLVWLKAGGRDFERLTPKVVKNMGVAYAKGLMDLLFRRTRDSGAPIRMAAEEYLKELQLRIQTGGGDVRKYMRPLKASTIERKRHSVIGFDTGDLRRAIANAQIIVKKDR